MKVAKLTQNAILPTRKHATDAGIDLYARDSVEVLPNSYAIVNTGITIELFSGSVGLILPKSRNNHLIGAGVVDSDYQGEILVKVINYTNNTLFIERGEAIAQMVITQCFTPVLEEVSIDNIHKTRTTRADTGGIVSQRRPIPSRPDPRVGNCSDWEKE